MREGKDTERALDIKVCNINSEKKVASCPDD